MLEEPSREETGFEDETGIGSEAAAVGRPSETPSSRPEQRGESSVEVEIATEDAGSIDEVASDSDLTSGPRPAVAAAQASASGAGATNGAEAAANASGARALDATAGVAPADAERAAPSHATQEAQASGDEFAQMMARAADGVAAAADDPSSGASLEDAARASIARDDGRPRLESNAQIDAIKVERGAEPSRGAAGGSPQDERGSDDGQRSWSQATVQESDAATRADRTLRALSAGMNAAEELAGVAQAAADAADAEGAAGSQASASVQSSATAKAASTGASAVAARLAEVERNVARDRAAQSIEQGILEISVGPAGESVQLGASSSAAGAAQTGLALDALDGTAAAGALTDPAQDLSASTLDARQTARLAAKGVDVLANHRGGAITMRLEPPALGQLRIELRVSHGAVVADFTAATAEARVLLEANLGMLRERLESQGLTVERMSVHGGARGAETAPVAAPQSGDLRQDANGNGSDSRERGDRSDARQDAGGGESRGRSDADREGRSRDGREPRADAAGLHAAGGNARSFVGILNAQRTQDGGGGLRKAV